MPTVQILPALTISFMMNYKDIVSRPTDFWNTCFSDLSISLMEYILMVKSDPIVGAWKLNVAMSKFSSVLLKVLNETVPKEKTEIYQELDDRIVMTVSATLTGREPISAKYSWPRQGSIARILENVPSMEGISIIETLIAPGEWYVTFLKDGKQLLAVHKVVSKDGKTMNLTYIGADAQGNCFDQIDVYDRQ